MIIIKLVLVNLYKITCELSNDKKTNVNGLGSQPSGFPYIYHLDYYIKLKHYTEALYSYYKLI